MRVPESLAGLLDQGIIQEIVRPLMSGKEAQVYLVTAGGQPRVAKIYKDSQHRSFKQRAEYTEGRRVRSSRDQRAMQKRTRYGRKQDEAAWKSAEVDMIYRLRYAGVRVPEPYTFIDGVLLMELVQDADGHPAPRLAEVDFDRGEAREIYDLLLREVVKMLCAGVVHGDLSEYNVLLAERGPVIIDFPQSVDAAANQSAKKLLLRDVDNLTRFLTRLDHRARPAPYGHEIWAAYERNRLTPEMPLTGRVQRSTSRTDTSSLLDEIHASERDEAQRRRALGLPQRRREVTMQPSGPTQARSEGRRPQAEGRGPSRGQAPPTAQRSGQPSGQQEGAPKRRRRRRKKANGATADATPQVQRSEARSEAREPKRPHEPNRPAQVNGERAPKRAHEREQPRRADGAPKVSADPQRGHGKPDANASSEAAPKRRRRRRRPRAGQPPVDPS